MIGDGIEQTLHTGLSREAPPSREAGQASGQDPGPRKPVFSPKMTLLFPKDEPFAFQEQERWLRFSVGMNGSESSALRNLTHANQGSDPVFSE